MSEDLERAAHLKLQAAIEEYYATTEPENHGILSDWALVSTRVRYEADGTNSVSTGYTASEHQPSWRTLGLLEYGSTVVRSEIQDSMRGDF